MAKLAELVAARGYVKGCITRLETYCNSSKVTSASLEALKEKKLRLIKAFEDYEQYNRAILNLDTNDAEDYLVVEEKRDACIAILSKRCSAEAHKAGQFKSLPTVHIQKFDGINLLDYYPFINMFRAVIDADSKLSLCEKLYYLRSFLSGEALDLIKNLMLTDASYDVALKLLDDRYNNIPLIVNFHVNSIVDMAACTKCTAPGLRSIVSTVNMHLAALRNLNEKVEHWDTLLVNILSKKVDSYTYRAFHLERNVRQVPNLREFIAFLEKRATALEVTAVEKSERSIRPVTNVAVASGVTCKFCHEPHKIYQCVQFKMLNCQERYDFADANNLCKLCLNRHPGRCQLKLKCAHCHLLHNSLLHFSKKNRKANVKIPRQNLNSSFNLDDDLSFKSSLLTANTSVKSQIEKVLLPTARVKLMNRDGTVTEAKALLDSASQISYISEKLLKHVNSCVHRTDEIVTGICNGENSVTKRAEIAVNSSVNNFKINVSCCVTKDITCPLPQKSFDISQLNIPSNVRLADRYFNETDEISLLLGSDIFFKVLQRESIPLTPSGLSLINTSFGYVAAGTLPVSTGKI